MPVVVAVIATIVGAVASAVGVVIAAVVSVVTAVVGTIATIISPIVAGITTALSTVLGPILGPINQISSLIDTKLLNPINIMALDILGPVNDIQRGIDGGIVALGQSISPATEPVLRPMINSLSIISQYVGGVNNIITDELAPITETAALVRSIATIRTSQQLLAGVQNISEVIGGVADTAGAETAAAITTLMAMTTRNTIGVMTIMDDRFLLVNDEIVTAEERIIDQQETAIDEISVTLDDSLAGISNEFTAETRRLELEVSLAERRVTELPWFQTMMIRGFA